MSQSGKFHRRQFILNSARTFAYMGISSTVANTLLGKIMGQALAATQPNSHFYIHFSLAGGPPRWYFDQILKPFSSSSFDPGGFGTGLTINSEGLAVASFQSTSMDLGKTYLMPPVWRMSRDGYDNKDLLQHTQMFRGIDKQINNHSISRIRQVAPVIGGSSIGGLLADEAGLPIASAGTGVAHTAFKSPSGKAGSNVALTGSTNPVTTLLSPFRQNNAALQNQQEWARVIETSLNEFDHYAENIGVKSESLANAYKEANSLITTNKVAIAEQWQPIVAKYKAALNEALSRRAIDKFFPKALKADGTARFQYTNSRNLTTNDMRELFNSSPTINGFAESFALAEILVLNNITSNVSLDLLAIRGLLIGTARIPESHDQHFLGSSLSVLVNTAFYRAVINSLHELVAALKTGGIFNKSVIHISSEFSRTPRVDHSGSDHAFAGSSSTIISGMIQQFGLIGNIHRTGGSGTYPGTWGRAANFSNFGRPIYVQDIANTIGMMLGLGRMPSDNGKILLNASDNWKPVSAEAKNV